MYYKEINGRIVFSDCKTILLEFDHPPLVSGQWVSNPDSQLVYDENWRVYVPPVIPPIPQTEPDYDQLLSAVKTMLASSVEEMTDEEALEVAALFPTWASKIGEAVTAGERLWYNTKLYKVLQPHTVQEDWTPDTAVSLYVEVSIEEIPEWVQPLGAQDAYRLNDKVKHNGHTWQSNIDYNTYEPGVYGWTQLD